LVVEFVIPPGLPSLMIPASPARGTGDRRGGGSDSAGERLAKDGVGESVDCVKLVVAVHRVG
jgi:hypothetical protein